MFYIIYYPKMKKVFQQYKRDGITLLETLGEKDVAKMVEEANRLYFAETQGASNQPSMPKMTHEGQLGASLKLTPEGQQPLTDAEYDILKEYMERKYPQNPVLQQVGSSIVSEKNKIALPFEMASMNKIKPDTEALTAWKRRFSGPYVVSCKLDGVSGLYIHSQIGEQQLMTRGDGRIGQDISYLIPLLHLPVIPPGSAVRGEFILPKSVFADKYSQTFANARNLVSGIINAKTVETDKVRDMHFVVYEVIAPVLPPSEQMAWLAQHRLETVQHVSNRDLTNETLSETLLDWRTVYAYEMDGLVVTQDAMVPRKPGNPEHAFAFKMALSENSAEAKVVDVVWSPSKDGYLKPRVRIEPVRLSGTTIEYATGFNAKFIQDNRIGVGAVIRITRSGDVIPFIQGVVSPAEYTKMPPAEMGETAWTASGVDLVLKNKEDNRTVAEKNITAFFTYFKVESLSAGNVAKLYAAGYDSVEKILRMSQADFQGVPGFQQVLSSKIHKSIHEKTAQATLLDWVVASGKMGRGLGRRKLALILEAYPDITKADGQTDAQKTNLLQTIPGIGPENATEFVCGLPAFRAFMTSVFVDDRKNEGGPMPSATNKPVVPIREGPLNDKKIVMSKIRDKRILEEMAKQGATLEDRVTKNTFVLVVPFKEETSNKVQDAQKHGVPIMDPAEFTVKYLL